MKTSCKTLASILAGLVLTAELSSAAVPTEWQVRIGPKATVYQAERYHGDALDLRATLTSGGLPLVYQGAARLYAQTNGMGALWWDLAPVTVASNVLAATWRPEFDTGADVVDVFLGAPSNFQAHARIRFLPSPGPAPNSLPMPTPVLDFAAVEVRGLAALTNGWSFGSSADLTAATNYTDAALGEFARTNEVLKSGPYLSSTGGVVSTRGGITVHYSGATLGAWPQDSWIEPHSIGMSGGVMGGNGIEFQDRDVHVSRMSRRVTMRFPLDDSWEDGADVGDLALRSDIPDMDDYATKDDAESAARSAASAAVEPVSNLVETVRTESALVYRLYQGSNVVAEVTNYNSQVHAPELRIMQLNESNEYVVVWAETNGLSRTLASARQYADDATGAVVQAVAPRAWSKVTAGLGFEAPSNTTWLSTGRTVIAGGLEYEKHMTSGGTIWLLESNGMTADFHAQTNNTAFIDLSNADGTPIFRVEKTDSFLVGVHVDSVTVDGDTLVCGVGVVAADHPLVRVKAQLESGEWAKEEDGIPASLATVTWSGTTGNWTCRIQNNTGGSTLFAQMEYFQEGGTKIVNSAALDVSEGILCTDGIHKCRPVYNNGSITWEVVP